MPTDPDSWRAFRTLGIDLPSLGMRIDPSRMGLDSERLAALQRPMAGALEAMARLEAGGIANPDEQRQVGHYWLRAPDLAPDPAASTAIRETQARIRDFSQRVLQADPALHRGPFRHFLLIGIGGSALGPQLLDDALPTGADGLSAHFLDNTDPDGIERTLARLEPVLEETLVIIVSKSGGTAETRNGMLEAQEVFKRRGVDFGSHAVAVTVEGSALDRLAREKGFLDVFPIWPWVGGRFSITSAVGLLPAALRGFDIDAFLAGAREMDVLTRHGEVMRNPAAVLALSWHVTGEGRGVRDMVVLPYRDRLLLLSRYLQQLVMESLGKELDLQGRTVHQGIVVYGNKGSTDQHAFVQQLREGPDNFFVTFIQARRDRGLEDRAPHGAALDRGSAAIEIDPGVTSGDYLLGFLLGTREALTEKGRRSLLLTLPEISEKSLGALIALFERAVGLYASLAGINAYHQPGVEAGKRAAGKALELQSRLLALLAASRGDMLDAETLAARLDPPGDPEMVFHLLEHLAANGRLRAAPADPWWQMRFGHR